MGNKPSAPPPPNKCTTKRAEVTQLTSQLQQTQQQLDTCDPGQAQARNDALKQQQGAQWKCMTAAQKLNQTNSDQAVWQQQLDQCDPQAAFNRRLQKATEENTAWVNDHRARAQAAQAAFAEEKITIQRLADAIQPLQEFNQTLLREIETLTKSIQGREQTERKYRRQFLDGDPQGGVGGVPAVRTNDDRVLFAFWIALGAAVVTTVILLLQMRGVNEWKPLTLASSLAVLITFIFVRAVISAYA